MYCSLTRTLRKVMDDKEERWDDYIEGALFALNTNKSTTTKYSPFYLMFGRNPRLPFEVEKLETPLTDADGIEQLTKDISSEEAVKEHVEQMSALRESLFPVVDRNIKRAQEKQKENYKKRKGWLKCPYKVGDMVLHQNMLQKTKAGHKMEDQWLGPYTIAELNADKGICRLVNRSGKKLAKQVPLKQVKGYKQPDQFDAEALEPRKAPEPKPRPLSTSNHLQQPSQTPPVPKPRTKLAQRPPATKPIPKPRNIPSHKPKLACHVPSTVPVQILHSQAKSKQHYIPAQKREAPVKPDDSFTVSVDEGNSTSEVGEGNVEPPCEEAPKGIHVGPSSVFNEDTFDDKIKEMEEEDIKHLFCQTKDELHSILKGEEKSWRCDILHTGHSELLQNLAKKDLPFNVFFGGISSSQQDAIITEISASFPEADKECKLKVLLPEALIRICRNWLKISFDEAEHYLEHVGSRDAEMFISSMKEKVAKRHFLGKNPAVAKRAKLDADGRHSMNTEDDEDCTVTRVEAVNESSVQRKRPKYQVDARDESLITKNGLLTDMHIGTAQNLLHQQFPHIKGFQPTTLGAVGQFEIMDGEFIQILYTGNCHWICVSNVGCTKENEVNLYDSMYSAVTAFTKKQIAALLNMQSSDEIQINIKPVGQQSNGTDCGVYAIAFATALCYGHDPCMEKFNRRHIRKHLWKCFTEEYMQYFPSKPQSPPGVSKKVRVAIYCHCRLPFNHQEDAMVECATCKKWFHQNCQKVPAVVFKRKSYRWKCSSCISR